MKLSEVKANMGKIVYYPFNGKVYECILSACIFRVDKNGNAYYQAELTEKSNNRSIMIASLKDVFLSTDLKTDGW